jgi:localization factor PodJL
MRPDIPWNVAGIPPEAREAARAAARREGLSVGEWMTRRILRSFSDSSDDSTAARDVWPANVSSFNVAPDSRTSRRDTEDMLAHVARSENESGEVFRRIEEQLRGVARRLEATERSQSENNRAMTKAASEINVAAREQAQAFDQLGASVIGLADRIDRVERVSANEGLKDAVKGLHQGLSRLADQISATANQSASQISALADNLESVAGRLGQVRSDAEATNHILEQRIAQIDEHVRAVERLAQASVEAIERQLEERLRSVDQKSQVSQDLVNRHIDERLEGVGRQIDERLQGVQSTIDERLHSVELKAQAGQDAVNRQIAERIENVELLAQANQDAIVHAVASLEVLKDEDAEAAKRNADAANAISRLEDNIAKLEPRGTDPVIDQRLSGIERTLSEIASRFEQPDKSAAAVEDDLKRLAERIEAAEAQHREAISELRTVLNNTSCRVAAAEPAPHPVAETPAMPVASAEAEPAFDAPPPVEHVMAEVAAPFADGTDPFAIEEEHAPAAPVHEESPPPFTAESDPFAAAPAHEDAPPPFAAETNVFAEPEPAPFEQEAASGFKSDPFAVEPPAGAAAAGADSYLSAARRSARAAAAQVESQVDRRGGGFAWGAAAFEEDAETQPRSRRTYIVVGVIALVLILAIVAGAILSQRISATSPHTAGPLFDMAKPVAVAPHPAVVKPAPVKQTTANASPLLNTVVVAPADGTTAPAVPAPTAATGVKPLETHAVAPAPLHAVPAANSATSPPTTAPAVHTAPTRMATTAPIDKLTALATSGNAKAELVVGLKYLDGDGVAVSETDAAKWLERAAEAGLPVAQYRLGTMYERGRGVAADAVKSVHWYTLAAQAGNRKAMHNLAVAYASGTGVPKNLAEAARWFSKAAALGLSDSQFNLAVLYERGLGVPQSLLDAYKWYAIAAAAGDAESKSRIDALGTQLSADDRAAAQHSADAFHAQPLNPKANVAPQLSEITN